MILNLYKYNSLCAYSVNSVRSVVKIVNPRGKSLGLMHV